jgi:hypothetical protein
MIIAIISLKNTKILLFRAITQRYMKYSGSIQNVLMTYPDNKTIENWIFNCTQN